tara:strand:- start:2680 stop:3078 length:399 start_codon:yes stop_codon:yes gene_type:complete
MQYWGLWDTETGLIISGPQSVKGGDDWLPIVNFNKDRDPLTQVQTFSLSEDKESIIATTTTLSTNIDAKNRALREKLLNGSDWTQLPDVPLSAEKKQEILTYRQALRDITNHSNWPNLNSDDWPDIPLLPSE